MKRTWTVMGMPVSLAVDDKATANQAFEEVRDYFQYVDDKYSPYKSGSEVCQINEGLSASNYSPEMRRIIRLCQQTSNQTDGYFDVWHKGEFDPSGLVKGWAINNAARLLRKMGLNNFYVEAGGDVQVGGHNPDGRPWHVGIRNPFNRNEIVKVLRVTRQGVATSGTYIRGRHIYNPKTGLAASEVASLTVIGPNIYDADRFATAAFAMGRAGIGFIESLTGHEAYMITSDQRATFTTGFLKYVGSPA